MGLVTPNRQHQPPAKFAYADLMTGWWVGCMRLLGRDPPRLEPIRPTSVVSAGIELHRVPCDNLGCAQVGDAERKEPKCVASRRVEERLLSHNIVTTNEPANSTDHNLEAHVDGADERRIDPASRSICGAVIAQEAFRNMKQELT